jgi:hypothetical protein
MRVSLLGWRQRRYLKAALLLAAASTLLYASQGTSSAQPPNGGTWQGYVLGITGAILIVWLALLGVRKRRYSSNLGTVQGWTSAHVYLGTALLLVATLHCAAQFGWNVHTLAYGLMCLVIFSGFYGLYVYMHLPGRISANKGEKNPDLWHEELSELDEQIRSVSRGCDADLQAHALSALDLTHLGGSIVQQLTARDRSQITTFGGGSFVNNAEQQIIIETLVKRIPDARRRSEAEVLNQLLALFGRRQVILHILRKDVQLRGWVKIWLYFHIPTTVALIVALSIHVFSVLIYW